MSNVRPDHLTRFRPTGAVPLSDRPVSVKLPVSVDAFVRAMPEPSEWLRRVICEAVERELKSSNNP
ncbi:hypothetical protein IFO70_22180 [Phormidium tenue FACHB-886]|nr:hypothetical protein [Phormidium tenue FACHB-886]